MTQVKSTVETLAGQNQGYMDLLEEYVRLKGSSLQGSTREEPRLSNEVEAVLKENARLKSLFNNRSSDQNRSLPLIVENERLQEENRDLSEQCQNLQTLLTSVTKTVNETTASSQQTKEHVICIIFMWVTCRLLTKKYSLQ
jgi:myosin heavy subunit